MARASTIPRMTNLAVQRSESMVPTIEQGLDNTEGPLSGIMIRELGFILSEEFVQTLVIQHGNHFVL